MKWHMCIRLRRPLERFAAVVDVGATAELNPCHALVREAEALEALQAEAMRDSPSKAILARIVAALYVVPPSEGRPSDDLAAPAEGGSGMISLWSSAASATKPPRTRRPCASWGLCTTPRAGHESAPLRRLSTSCFRSTPSFVLCESSLLSGRA